MADNQVQGGIENQSYLSLLVDGQSLPTLPNLIRRLDIVENTFAVPCAVIELIDRANVLRSKHAIVDGTKITVIFGRNIDNTETLNFQVSAVREFDSGDGSRGMRLICPFDASSFLYNTAGLHIKGTSIQALKQLCAANGLTLDSDISTNDSMTWVSLAQSPKKFMSEIEPHMWIDESSLPRIVLTADKRMIVRDLNKLMHQTPKAVFCFDTPMEAGEYSMQEFRPKSVSGVFNGVSNYGERLLWASSDGKTNELKSVGVSTKDPLNINSDTRGDIVGTRHSYASPTNDINLHKNFQKAYYNYKRQSLAYTESARALIKGQVPDVDLFSVIEVKASIIQGVGDSVTDVKSSGNWLIIGRTRSFIGGQYVEAFLLTRNFTPVEGTTNVGGGGNIIQVPVATVASVNRLFQINQNITQAVDGTSPIDYIAQSHDLRLNVMLDQFQTDSEMFNYPELAEKYGEGKDYLNAVLQEFSMAKFLSGICQALNKLEKFSVNLVIDYGPTILSALADRIDSMEGMLGSFTGDINGLIANGDIPAEYLDGPQLNQRCVSNKLGDLQKSMNDALPDNCLDALSISKLMGPSTNLSQLIRQAEEQLRNLLCAMGDGTVDGSSNNGAPNGQKLEMYMPKVAS